ncbi:MAG TPA: hypothetical protein VN618_15815 [Solirubrobacteraceae bacterium]|nr:hypothetical protein [Solirubrobacteraceae bacterium]
MPSSEPSTHSIVVLPASVEDGFEVYLNGVLQRPEVDFRLDGRHVVFARTLLKDRISGWRWFLGAWGVGTYRQNDTVDIRFELDGQPYVAHDLPIAHAEGDPILKR